MTGKNLIRYFLIVCFMAACFQAAVAKDHQEKQSSLSADGPYILYDSTGGFRMVWVGEDADPGYVVCCCTCRFFFSGGFR